MKQYKKIEKNEVKEQKKELKQSYVMKSHIYKYLIKKYNMHPILELGAGAFFDNADYAIDLYDNTAKNYCNFMRHNLNVAPYPLNKKFNTIKCFRTIEYLENPRVLIKEAYKLLDDDGTFIILINNSKEVNDRWIKLKGLPIKTNSNVNETNLKKMLTQQGFSIEMYYNSFLGLNFKFLQPLWRLINGERTYFICKKLRKRR